MLKSTNNLKHIQKFIDAVKPPFPTLIKDQMQKRGFAHTYIDESKVNALSKYYREKLIPHKIAVYEAGLTLKDHWSDGSYVVRLCYHDLSKFSHAESAYAFYNFSGINTEEMKNSFAAAWNHHKHNNSHHPEHWISVDRNGVCDTLPMPHDDVVEMVADWIGAGKTYGSSLQEWLPNNIHTFWFHEQTMNILQPILEDVTEFTFQQIDNHLFCNETDIIF